MAGHIRKRKRADGTVRYQARRPDLHRGGTAKVEKTFRTKTEAQRWLAEQEVAAHSGSYLDPRRLDRPFREVVDEWRATWGRLQPNTVYNYTKALENHLLPEFGAMKIGAITRRVLVAYFNRHVAAGRLSPASIRRLHAVMRAAMNEAIRLDYVQHNPCTLIRLPRQEHREMLFLSADEVRTLAESINPHFRALIYCAAYTGLRAGELGGLRRRDLDQARGVLHVQQALKDIDGKLILGPTKTHAVRAVRLPGFLLEMLVEYLGEVRALGAAPDDPLFPNPGGGWLHHKNFYNRHFKPTVRRVLPPEKHALRFHDLRHTCVAMLIALNAHPRAIQTRLGHQTVAMTMDRYGHMLPSLEEPLADALDGMFSDSATVGLSSVSA